MNPVRWFFIVGGFAFLLAGLFVREMSFDGADETALTFLLIGGFWAGPQLLIMFGGTWFTQWRARRQAP